MVSKAVLIGIFASGAVAVGVGGYALRQQFGNGQDAMPSPPAAPSEVAVSEPVTEPPASELAATSTESAVDPDVVSDPAADAPIAQATPTTPGQPLAEALPTFDLVRVDANGAAVVAGTGPAASDVVLRLDGQEVATARTDRQGNFVSLFDVPTLDAPRILTLEAQEPGGGIRRAEESVIVAPTFPRAPSVAAAPSAQTEPATQSIATEVASADDPAPSAPIPPSVAAPVAAALQPPASQLDELPLAAASPVSETEEDTVAVASVVEPSASGLPQVEETPPSAETPPSVETVAAAAPVDDVVQSDAPPTATTQLASELTLPVIAAAAALDQQTATPADTAAAVQIAEARPAVSPPVRQGSLPPTSVVQPGPEAASTVPAEQITVAQDSAVPPTEPQRDTAPVEPIRTAAKQPERPAAPRLFRAGPAGITVVSDGPGEQPSATIDLGIDIIAYDAAGDVQLTGTGQRDSELRIYLDNRPVQTVQVDGSGAWTSPLPNVDTGVYTLRIDEVTADGDVVSRIETPFQRTAPEIAAQLRREGATAITVQPGYTLWAISEGYFGTGIQYVQLFEANRDQIRDPDLIYPGQVFALPPDQTGN